MRSMTGYLFCTALLIVGLHYASEKLIAAPAPLPTGDASAATLHINVYRQTHGTKTFVGEATGFLISSNGYVVSARHITVPAVQLGQGESLVYEAALGNRDGRHERIYPRASAGGQDDIALFRFNADNRKVWPYLALAKSPRYVRGITHIHAWGFALHKGLQEREGKITRRK